MEDFYYEHETLDAAIEATHIACLLGEIRDGTAWTGEQWNDASYDTSRIDGMRAELIEHIERQESLLGYSLELQMWWRDYQRERNHKWVADAQAAMLAKERAIVLAKLTPHQRKVLDID